MKYCISLKVEFLSISCRTEKQLSQHKADPSPMITWFSYHVKMPKRNITIKISVRWKDTEIRQFNTDQGIQ